MYDKLKQVAEEGLRKVAEIEKQRPLNESEIKSRQELSDLSVALIEKQADDEIAAILNGIKQLEEVEQKKQKAQEARTNLLK